MRAVRIFLVAAVVLSLPMVTAQAGPFFDCLRSEKFVIPPITTPWGSTTGNIVIQPANTQQSPVQSGLGDAFANKFIEVLLTNLLSGNGGNPVNPPTNPPSGSSDSMKRANDTLDRIDGKIDKLEQLIVVRLTKVESDVATVAKAQRDSFAQYDQRLVETMNAVNENTKLIKANADAIHINTKAILQTQKETASLSKQSGNPLPATTADPATDAVPPTPSTTVWLKNNVDNAPVVPSGSIPPTKNLLKGSKLTKLIDLQSGKVLVRLEEPNKDGSGVPEWYDVIVNDSDLSNTNTK